MKKRYPKQFKINAVHEVIHNQKKVKEVAADWQVPTQTLYNWINTYKQDGTFYGSGHRKNTDKQRINQLEVEHAILKHALFLPKKTEAIFDFIYMNKDTYPITTMCRLLDVSESGYYKYTKNLTSQEQLRNQQIEKLVREIYIEKGPDIGSPAITVLLNQHEFVASQATVARILSKNKKEWHTSYPNFHKNNDVKLQFPNKDTLFDKDTERYYNEKLAKDEIDTLLSSVSFSNFQKHERNMVTDVSHFKDSDNLVILGDNLFAVHKLQETFTSKVKLIYIDLPYNTSRNNLSYRDSYSRANYMVLLKNRLELALPLLKQDGVIFLHCDDNQQAYIKVLCDEIFGEENFVNQIVWQRTSGQQNKSHIATTTDYILIYAKDKRRLNLNKNKRTLSQLKTYKFQDEHGYYRIDRIQDKKDGYYTYSIQSPTGESIHSNWMYPKHTFEKLKSQNLIYWSRNNVPYRKAYLTDKPTVILKDLWLADTYGTTREASAELKKAVGNNHFTYPKPERLLKQIIELTTIENDIVLDFFAGSGTTAVVSSSLNRQWIAVELNTDNFDLILKRLEKSITDTQSFISCQLKQ